MFTGIIEHVATVVSIVAFEQSMKLTLESAIVDAIIGESIAINGVCLTVTMSTQHVLSFDVSSETLNKTTLGSLRVGQRVHLERALRADQRFGGHYVTGHVDTKKTIIEYDVQGDYVKLLVGLFSKDEQLFLLPKGSITLDGVSLTINRVYPEGMIELMLIPHTLQETTFSKATKGSMLNVEFDYFTRIIAHQLGSFKDSIIMSDFQKDREVYQDA